MINYEQIESVKAYIIAAHRTIHDLTFEVNSRINEG
jgi:hypothetical protein